MRLFEAINSLESLDSDATIWIDGCETWSANSTVNIAVEKQSGGAPESVPKSHEYFLEVFVVLELVESLGGLSSKELVNRVLDYAINDA